MLLGVYRSCSFLRKATMLLLKSGHEVGNPYSCPGCHPERSAGSVRPASQTRRGVYPERSEWAQGDRHSLQMSPLILKACLIVT
jgi:hypothetical protein